MSRVCRREGGFGGQLLTCPGWVEGGGLVVNF